MLAAIRRISSRGSRRDPQQVSTGLSVAQVLPALVGAVLGIAEGLALFAPSASRAVTQAAAGRGAGHGARGSTTIPARVGARPQPPRFSKPNPYPTGCSVAARGRPPHRDAGVSSLVGR
jgi:hypothetical protein